MPQPHVIRLSRAWEFRAASANSNLVDASEIAKGPAMGRVDLPWEDAAAHSNIYLLSRRFNRPSNLDPAQRVILAIEPPALAECVTLNDTPLTDGPRDSDIARFDVAPLLKRYNRIHILAPAELLAAAGVRLVIQEIDEPTTFNDDTEK